MSELENKSGSETESTLLFVTEQSTESDTESQSLDVVSYICDALQCLLSGQRNSAP